MLRLGFQQFDFVIITENSQSLATEWSRVRNFLGNLVEAIGETRPQSMPALYTYRSTSEQLLPLARIYHYYSTVYFINENVNATTDTSTDGIIDALMDVQESLLTAIEMRLSHTATDGQVVILFSHSDIENSILDQTKEILSWFMNAGVYVVAVSK